MSETAGDEDLYKLVSGFYGPGFLGCWYILVTSVLISWVLDPRYRFCITYDLIAAVAYPTVAAAHLLIQIVNFPKSGVQYMVVNLASSIMLAHGGPGPVILGEESSGHIYLADLSSPERTKLYPRVASINVSLRVVDNFTYLALLALIFSLPGKNYAKAQVRHRRSILLIFGGSLILSWAAELVLVIKICTSAAHGKSDLLLLSLYMRLVLLLWASYWLTILFYTIWIIRAATTNILRIYRHPNPLQKIHQHWANWTGSTQAVRDGDNPPRILDALKIFLKLALIFLTILAGLVLYGVIHYIVFPRLILFPLAGSTLMELDQAAALAGGLFNLGLTLHGGFGRIWGVMMKLPWNRQTVGVSEGRLPTVRPRAL